MCLDDINGNSGVLKRRKGLGKGADVPLLLRYISLSHLLLCLKTHKYIGDDLAVTIVVCFLCYFLNVVENSFLFLSISSLS